MKRIVWTLAAAVTLVILSRVAMGAYAYVTERALYSVTLCATSHAGTSQLTAAREVMQHRLDALGVTHSAITADGGQCVRVGVPRAVRRQAVSVLTSPGMVVIADGAHTPLPPGRRVILVCPPSLPKCAAKSSVGSTTIKAHPPVLQIVVPASEIQKGGASAGYDMNGVPTVTYTFTSAGTARWCRFTSIHTGTYGAIVIDNRVLEDPLIMDAICSNQTQITLGEGGTLDEAKRVAAYLNSGPYPAGIGFQLKGR